MLPLTDAPFIYHPPKPFGPIISLAKQFNRFLYLKGDAHKIISVENINSNAIKKLHKNKKSRILFLINHPTHSDPQIIIESYRQLGFTSFFMAAYDLFIRKNSFDKWIMQKMGTFSMDREAFHSEPIKQAVKII